MPTITGNVDDDLKERMEKHPEINWIDVTRQAIREKIELADIDERGLAAGIDEAFGYTGNRYRREGDSRYRRPV